MPPTSNETLQVSQQPKNKISSIKCLPFCWEEIDENGKPRAVRAEFSHYPRSSEESSFVLTCAWCGHPFRPKPKANKRTRYCSPECLANSLFASKQQKAAARLARNNARLAAKRRDTYLTFDGRECGGQDIVHGPSF